jgi:tetratricopeptide (TPR) repeat protein
MVPSGLLASQTRSLFSGREAQTPMTASALQAWVEAVAAHEPGRRDASVVAMTSMSYEARRNLHASITLFLSALLSEGVEARSPSGRRVVQMGLDAARSPGAAAFLKRAAVLHADAAMSDYPIPPIPSTADAAPRGDSPASALLSGRRFVLSRDGEILGDAFSNWNWPFARSLLDLLPSAPTPDPFKALWYHATTAYMFKTANHAELAAHLDRAAVVLPDEAQLLFDRASYAELQGLPIKQIVRASRSQTARAVIPPEAETNAQAERLFRRTLQIEPGFVEARVRLGRLLTWRSRNLEAADELAAALDAHPEGTVAFFAHLFAGRVAQALGRLDDASRQFQEAVALSPSAQSALLAQSQVALKGNDISGALAPLRALDPSPSPADPWWEYRLGPGRDANALLTGMWAQVPR